MAAALLGAPRAAGQATLELRVSDPDVFVNEPFRVEVIIRNFTVADEPQFPESSAYAAQSGGITSDSSQIMIVNGRRETLRSRSYLFELTAVQAGVLTIPPLALRVDGEVLRTRPEQVVVQESRGAEPVFAELTAEHEQVYVGQRFKLTLSLWVRPAVARRGALTAREMFTFIDLRRSTFGPFPVPETFTQKSRPGPDGAQVNHYVYTSTVDYVAERPGALVLDDVAIQIQYPTRFGRDFIGDEVVQGVRRMRVRPAAAGIEVLALPSQGRPADFTGAVGSFRLSVSARPTNVRVGDPIELTISIHGNGPLETLPPPALADQPGLTEHFRVPRETLAGEVVRGARRFTQVIRPKSVEVTTIPPITYSFFNPATGRYEQARSEPISIRVEGGSTLAAADLGGPAPPPDAGHTRQQPLSGLADNFADERLLLRREMIVRPGHVAAATLAPPAAYLAIWGGLALRQRRAATARARRPAALRNALRRLDSARSHDNGDRSGLVEAALVNYAADRLELPPAGLTGRSAVDRLREQGMSGQILSTFENLVARCEAERYSPSARRSDELSLIDEAADCLRRLEAEAR